MIAPLHGKAKRSVEGRQIILPQAPRLPFPEPDSGDTLRPVYLIFHRDRVAAKVQPAG
jgi:hypothetical protein